MAFAAGSGIVNSSNITSSGGVAIDASAATGAVNIAQAAGMIAGAIKLSAHADVLTVSGGAIGGNVIGEGSNDTVDFAPGSGNTITYAHVISGVTTISLASGDLALGGGGSIAGNVTFTSASATLQLDTGVSQLGGDIVGAVTGDAIDLRFQAFTSGDQAIWQQNGTTGTLTLETAGGSTLAALTLSGQYTSANFSAGSDNLGGSVIDLVNPPPPPPPPPPAPGTTADMIMRDGNNGNYEIYDLGNNSILAAVALGQVGTEWQVAGLGGFFGTDTSDMILRNSNTGAVRSLRHQQQQHHQRRRDGAGRPGVVGRGLRRFLQPPGETDMLMRNSNTGAFEIYDIGNNQITSAAPMGQVGLEWSVAGFGDFSTRRQRDRDMLMRNSNTGAVRGL